MKVAILGASGFIGSRAVELMHLEQFCELRPVVRSYSSMASLARFDLDVALADAMNIDSLSAAFRGCDAVIHSIVGDPAVIVASAKACYEACVKENVGRLIYLSTAAVHALAPAEGTEDDSPIADNQQFIYNNAKVQAERLLLELSQKGSTELVILRPGIVYGPRSSRWSRRLAEDILSHQAFLIDSGSAICNAVYVDNLVAAIMAALTAEASEVNRQAFIISDAETVTWRDLYDQIAHALAVDPASIPRVDRSSVIIQNEDLVRSIQSQPLVQSILPFLPSRLKRTLKAALTAWTSSPAASGKRSDDPSRRWSTTAEIAALQSCQVKLPITKAMRLLGYQPRATFLEGSRRTADWLRFAGFPVRKDLNNGSLSVGSTGSQR